MNEIQRLDPSISFYASFLKNVFQSFRLIYFKMPQEIQYDIDKMRVINENRVDLLKKAEIKRKYPELWSFLCGLKTTNICFQNWAVLLNKWKIYSNVKIIIFSRCNLKYKDIYPVFENNNTEKIILDNLTFDLEHHYEIEKNLNVNDLKNFLYKFHSQHVLINAFFPFHCFFYDLLYSNIHLLKKNNWIQPSRPKVSNFNVPTERIKRKNISEEEYVNFFIEILTKNRMNYMIMPSNFFYSEKQFLNQVYKSIKTKMYNLSIFEILTL